MKNKMKKGLLLFAAITFVAIGSLQAQGFGIRGGLNLQNLNGKDDGKSREMDLATRFHIGVDYQMEVAPDFYLAPGLLFSTKGAKTEDSRSVFGADFSSTTNISLNYLEVPINFIYKPELGAGKLIVAFGPYLAYGIGGKIKTENSVSSGGDSVTEKEEEDVNFGSGDEDHFKPFDMGANIGFGYELSGGLSLKLNAQLGLANIMIDGDSDNSMKNTGFGLSVGYRF